MRKIRIILFIISLLFIAFAFAWADNIDSTYKYAWGENIGWQNWKPSYEGSDYGVTVYDTYLTGYLWNENIGWISLNCSNTNSCGTVDYKVSNDGAGNLSGYAWGENIGWINFDDTSANNYSQVVIDGDGNFSGYAWGENVGWINLSCENESSCGTVDFKVKTSWSANNPPYINSISDGGSAGSAPTNVGSNVDFTATSTDPDSDDWKLLVCATSSSPTPSTTTPACAGGLDWCVSSGWASSTASNTCAYTATSTDAESEAWWAWACDYNIYVPKCSTSSYQGTGDTGSPFKVNHWPTLTSISNDGPINPGDDISFSSVASDADVDTATDTVALLVCKTEGVSGTSCDGGAADTFCGLSELSLSNPSCTSTPVGVGSVSYYAYIFDNHNLGALENGTSSSFTINNATPTVSSVLVNGGANISLTEGATTTVSVTATVADLNGCGDIATTTMKFYRSGVGESCSADNNNCYETVVCSQDGGSCSGGDDTTATYTCEVDVWHYAEPTDSGAYEAENWVAKVTALDNNASSHSAANTTEIWSLSAFSITESIAYGDLALGETSSQQSTIITNTGNTRIDISITGTSMACDDVGSIPASYQRYSFASSFAWEDGEVLATTEPGTCSYFTSQIRGAGAAQKDADEAYILGGYDNTNSAFNTTIYSFDPSDTAKLARPTGHSLPQGLEYAPAVHYNSKIYLFGGYWLDASSTAHYSDQIIEYNPSSGVATSTGIGDLPVELAGASAGLNSSDNKIYVFGGWDNTNQQYNANIYRFDPVSPSSNATSTSHTLPQGIKDAALIYDETSGHFFLFGGYYDSGGTSYYSNNIVRYTGSGNATNVSNLPFELRGASATSKDADEAYIFGGWNNTAGAYNATILSYNPSSPSTNATSTSYSFLRGFKDAPAIYDANTGTHLLFGGFYGTGTPTYMNQITQWTPDVTVDYDINLTKPTTTPVTSLTMYWRLKAPSTGAKGVCSGTNTFVAVYDLETDIKAIRPNGSLCSSADECQSGYCIDGYCCDAACGGTCQACNVSGSEGACSYIPNGQDPEDECSVIAACDTGACDGAGSCGYYTSGQHGCSTCQACNASGECANTNTGWGDNLYGCTGSTTRCYAGTCRTCSGTGTYLGNDGCSGCAGQGGLACWRRGSLEGSCSSACSSYGGCVAANWNDYSSCTVMKAILGSCDSCATDTSAAAPFYYIDEFEGTLCRARSSTSKDCGSGASEKTPICVCQY